MAMATSGKVPIAICIGCGCDDRNRCTTYGPEARCTWEQVDRASGLGVCSQCVAMNRHYGRTFNGQLPIDRAYWRLCDLLKKVRASGGFYRAR